MLELIKKIFIRLLTGIVAASNHTMCVWLNMIQLTLINLYPNEYSHKFHYYPIVDVSVKTSCM